MKAMPAGKTPFTGRLSRRMPMNGCRNEAVIWKTSVITPIWKKVSANFSWKTG